MTRPARQAARAVLRQITRWLLIWTGWAIYAAFTGSSTFLSRAYSQKVDWKPAFRYSFLDASVWAVLTPLVFWLSDRFLVERRNWWYTVPIQVASGLVFAVCHVLIFVRLLPWIGYQVSPGLAGSVFRSRLHADLLTYWVVAGMRHGVGYFRKYRDRELKATQLEARLAQTQLQVLQMQLQPHFLFNTLHATSALVHKDAEAADRMISRLSDFLRLTLDKAGVQEVSLKDELESLDKYLDIEQVRFGDRLAIVRDVHPATLDLLLPSLILQPLAENAIRHSIAPRSAGGCLEIRSRREGERLVVEIADDGPGVAPSRFREGVGIANTRARLQQLYGSGDSLTFTNRTSGGLQVRLTVPARARAAAARGSAPGAGT